MPQDIEKRLEILEHKVESLEQLPERVRAVESQIVRLRTEMHDGLSALVGDIANMKGDATIFRAEVTAEFAATRALIKAGDDETRRYMRILHEDVIERLKQLGDARSS